VLGLVAAVCTTVSFVPQLLQTWRTKKAGDVAWGMLITFIVGTILWLTYGTLIHSMPVVVANAATLLLTATILGLKIYYR
jgi:MtN3 and saliva related transmembrane protein